MSILFLSKTTSWCAAAEQYLLAGGAAVTVCKGERGDAEPEAMRSWHGDYVISFVSPWIVPADVLSRARVAAINFHPGPPEYPGTGCYNFAIYDGAPQFGVTCHHMEPRVDTGAIVNAVRFPMLERETVALLKERTMAYLLVQFFEVASHIIAGRPLPTSGERWTRRPYTRRELDALCRLTPDMAADEIDRRMRATVFPNAPGPWLDLGPHRFVPKPE